MTTRSHRWKWQQDDKLRGAYGETDLDKKVIKINKKRHKSKSAQKIQKKHNGDEHLGKTIFHEDLHRLHPDWTEKQVRQHERKDWEKLPAAKKKKYYSKIK